MLPTFGKRSPLPTTVLGLSEPSETLPTAVGGLSEIIETLFLVNKPLSGILNALPTGYEATELQIYKEYVMRTRKIIMCCCCVAIFYILSHFIISRTIWYCYNSPCDAVGYNYTPIFSDSLSTDSREFLSKVDVFLRFVFTPIAMIDYFSTGLPYGGIPSWSLTSALAMPEPESP